MKRRRPVLAGTTPRAAVRRSVLALPLALLSLGAQAQTSQVTFSPSLRLTETITDNVSLIGGTGSGTATSKSDYVTGIIPSMELSSRGGRAQGNVRASVANLFYANNSNLNTSYLTFNGMGSVEAIEKFAYVDVRGAESREVASALGVRPADQVTGRANQASVRSFGISPYLRSRFHNSGVAELRYDFNSSSASSGSFQNMQQQLWTGSLVDETAFGQSGWSLAASDSQVAQTGRRDLHLQSARLTLMSRVTPQLQLRLIGGSEGNNYNSSETSQSTIVGAGFDWKPSPFGRVSATWEDRFFGPGYQMSGDYSTGLFVFNAKFSKDVTSSSQALSAVSVTTAYDLLMGLLAARYPDPATRDQAVRTYLTNQGVAADQQIGVSQSVLNNGVYLDRRLQFGASYVGMRRTTLLFTGYRSERSSLVSQTAALGSEFSSATRVTDTSGSLMMSHRLTPITSVNADMTLIRTQADGTATTTSFTNKTRRVSTGMSTSFTRRSSGSLTYRHSRASGTTEYTENALLGSVIILF